MRAADVVVASTSAPGFVVGADEFGHALRARRGRPLLLVDLAVPRDVDPAIAAIDGCFVYDIDDLEAVVEASLSGRRSEAVRAERLVAAEAVRFREWQASLAVVPAIASLRARAEAIRAAELATRRGPSRPSSRERAPRGRGAHVADREQAPPPADGASEGGRGNLRRRGLC